MKSAAILIVLAILLVAPVAAVGERVCRFPIARAITYDSQTKTFGLSENGHLLAKTTLSNGKLDFGLRGVFGVTYHSFGTKVDRSTPWGWYLLGQTPPSESGRVTHSRLCQ